MDNAVAHADLPQPPDPQEAPPLRWGIIGAGGIAGRFATEVPRFSAQLVTAIGSRSADKAASFAEQHGLTRAHGSYEDLVADPEVDVVYVASPHSHHAEHARLALEAGKHVLVEKAFTRNAAEARSVFDLAAQSGLFAMEAMWTRFLPHMVALRGLIDSGELGEVLQVRGDHGQHIPHIPRLAEPELAGGALLDLGVYPISFIHSLLGVPQAVHAAGTLTDKGVDGQEAVTLSYGRAVGVATASMLARSTNDGVVVGTRARVELPPTFYTPVTGTVVPLEGEPWSFGQDRPTGGFQYQAAEVARCVSAGQQQSEILPWSATLEVMEIMDEVRRQLGVILPGE